jgi:hypothetical protein
VLLKNVVIISLLNWPPKNNTTVSQTLNNPMQHIKYFNIELVENMLVFLENSLFDK